MQCTLHMTCQKLPWLGSERSCKHTQLWSIALLCTPQRNASWARTMPGPLLAFMVFADSAAIRFPLLGGHISRCLHFTSLLSFVAAILCSSLPGLQFTCLDLSAGMGKFRHAILHLVSRQCSPRLRFTSPCYSLRVGLDVACPQ